MKISLQPGFSGNSVSTLSIFELIRTIYFTTKCIYPPQLLANPTQTIWRCQVQFEQLKFHSILLLLFQYLDLIGFGFTSSDGEAFPIELSIHSNNNTYNISIIITNKTKSSQVVTIFESSILQTSHKGNRERPFVYEQ
ncbi:hypothetical protein RIR_jg32649.t1 [Rhizophagus irregularis DAOM 181602=DAOM 197198]|nr:hypothetical protein RIR_jg32649.t1 [Rhizophagus irregularis DAOM 181602=DAOM 197198]